MVKKTVHVLTVFVATIVAINAGNATVAAKCGLKDAFVSTILEYQFRFKF